MTYSDIGYLLLERAVYMVPSADQIMGRPDNFQALGGVQLNQAGKDSVAGQITGINKTDLDGAVVIGAKKGYSPGIVSITLEKSNGGIVQAALTQSVDYFQDPKEKK